MYHKKYTYLYEYLSSLKKIQELPTTLMNVLYKKDLMMIKDYLGIFLFIFNHD